MRKSPFQSNWIHMPISDLLLAGCQWENEIFLLKLSVALLQFLDLLSGNDGIVVDFELGIELYPVSVVFFCAVAHNSSSMIILYHISFRNLRVNWYINITIL